MALLEYDSSCNAVCIKLKKSKVVESEPIDVSKFSLPVNIVAKSRKTTSK